MRQEGEVKRGGSQEGRATLGMRELPALCHVGGRNNRSGGGNKEIERQQGSGPQIKGGGPQVKAGKAQKINTADFFQDKKTQKPISCRQIFDLASLCRADIGWVISKTASNWTSGTSTSDWRCGVRRRLGVCHRFG
jgi:hypothetical protein